jgi:hypothetical protein
MEVWKWLRQQSKDFHAAGFDALLTWWDKRISVVGGYVKKYIFFSDSNITCFTVYIRLWPIYWLFLVFRHVSPCIRFWELQLYSGFCFVYALFIGILSLLTNVCRLTHGFVNNIVTCRMVCVTKMTGSGSDDWIC